MLLKTHLTLISAPCSIKNRALGTSLRLIVVNIRLQPREFLRSMFAPASKIFLAKRYCAVESACSKADCSSLSQMSKSGATFRRPPLLTMSEKSLKKNISFSNSSEKQDDLSYLLYFLYSVLLAVRKIRVYINLDSFTVSNY